jgi:hypothetical protein
MVDDDGFELRGSNAVVIDDLFAGVSESEANYKRSRIELDAWTAWRAAQVRGDTRSLADFQDIEVDREVKRQARLGVAHRLTPFEWRDKPVPRTREQELEAAGMIYTLRDERREQAANEHRIRRRAVEAEVASQDRLHRRLAEAFGADYADKFMRGAAGYDDAGRC